MQAGAEPNDGLASLRTASSAIMGASGTNGLAGGSGGDNLAVIDATGRQPWHSGSPEPGVLFPNEEPRTYYVPPSMRNAIVISRLQREPFGPETRSAIRNGRDGGADIQTVRLTPEHQIRADQVGTIPADQLGNLSMAYETGFRPGQEDQAAGEVSSGRGDRGGPSYGAYQLSSAKGQVQNFLRQEGSPWASRFADLQPTQPGAFGEAWKDTAAGDPGNFFDAQHAYIERTHYEPVVAKSSGGDRRRHRQSSRRRAKCGLVDFRTACTGSRPGDPGGPKSPRSFGSVRSRLQRSLDQSTLRC